jgi:hypothetical protein
MPERRGGVNHEIHEKHEKAAFFFALSALLAFSAVKLVTSKNAEKSCLSIFVAHRAFLWFFAVFSGMAIPQPGGRKRIAHPFQRWADSRAGSK